MNFLSKVFPSNRLIFEVFLLIYTFCKSEIYWNGAVNSYYSDYYLI